MAERGGERGDSDGGNSIAKKTGFEIGSGDGGDSGGKRGTEDGAWDVTAAVLSQPKRPLEQSRDGSGETSWKASTTEASCDIATMMNAGRR